MHSDMPQTWSKEACVVSSATSLAISCSNRSQRMGICSPIYGSSMAASLITFLSSPIWQTPKHNAKLNQVNILRAACFFYLVHKKSFWYMYNFFKTKTITPGPPYLWVFSLLHVVFDGNEGGDKMSGVWFVHHECP